MSDVRVRKLQEFIKQEVSQMLMRGLKDPRIGFTTITDVHVTGDLREATIYVSLFGSDKEIFVRNLAKYLNCAIFLLSHSIRIRL